MSGFENTGVPEDEGQHLQTVFPPAKAYGGAGRFCFAGESRLDETSALLTSENIQRLITEWSTHWDLSKPVLVEKSPPNLIRSRFLQSVFDDSFFVFVVRHPLAVALATVKMSRLDPAELLRHWGCCHEIMLSDLPHVRKKMVIRYEDFVSNPHSSLSQICRHFGIEDGVKPGDFDDVKTTVNQQYFDAWDKEAGRLSSPPALRAAQRDYQRVWSAFGYDLLPPRIDAFYPESTLGTSIAHARASRFFPTPLDS